MKENKKPEVRRSVKDSVFCDLFSYPKYQLLLYRALHPEDYDVREEDISTVTLETVIINAIYNDLGILVRGRLLMLVEAQSSWSINIIVRLILYFAEEWKKYIQGTGQSVYSSAKVTIPKPEFYVIYTGEDKADVKTEYNLADEFFDGDRRFIDAKIHVITDGRQGDIINQYVTFTRVLNEQIRKYGRTKESIRETMRICRNEDVLSEYLVAHEQEVTSIMDILFDQDYNMKIIRKQEREEFKSEGEKEKGIKIALKMIANNEPDAKIQDYTDLSMDDIHALRNGQTVTV